MWKQPATVRLCTYIILHRHSTVGTSLQPHKKGYSDLWPPNSNQFSLKSRWRFVLNLTKKNPFWRIVLTRFEVNVTLTFDFHNLISLSKSQSCHWCQIWRNSLKVILRYCSQCATKPTAHNVQLQSDLDPWLPKLYHSLRTHVPNLKKFSTFLRCCIHEMWRCSDHWPWSTKIESVYPSVHSVCRYLCLISKFPHSILEVLRS